MEREEGALSMIERLSSGQVHLDLARRIEHEQQYAIRRSGRLPMRQIDMRPLNEDRVVRVTETTAHHCDPRRQYGHRGGMSGMATAQNGGLLTEAATFFAARKTAVSSWQLESSSLDR